MSIYGLEELHVLDKASTDETIIEQVSLTSYVGWSLTDDLKRRLRPRAIRESEDHMDERWSPLATKRPPG